MQRLLAAFGLIPGRLRTLLIGVALMLGILTLIVPSFAANLWVEYLGVLFAVFVLEAWFEREARRRTAPLRLAAIRDAEGIVLVARQLYAKVLDCTVLPEDSSLFQDGGVRSFSDPRLAPIYYRLRYQSRVDVIMAVTGSISDPYFLWGQYLANELARVKTLVTRFLERHSGSELADLVHAVQGMENTQFMLQLDLLTRILPQMRTLAGETFVSFASELEKLRTALDHARGAEQPPLLPLAPDRAFFESALNQVQLHPYESAAAPHRPPRPLAP